MGILIPSIAKYSFKRTIGTAITVQNPLGNAIWSRAKEKTVLCDNDRNLMTGEILRGAKAAVAATAHTLTHVPVSVPGPPCSQSITGVTRCPVYIYNQLETAPLYRLFIIYTNVLIILVCVGGCPPHSPFLYLLYSWKVGKRSSGAPQFESTLENHLTTHIHQPQNHFPNGAPRPPLTARSHQIDYVKSFTRTNCCEEFFHLKNCQS